jgi:hypothetical protein
MPASVYYILVHGADIVDGVILPVGHLSEVARSLETKIKSTSEKVVRGNISVINK